MADSEELDEIKEYRKAKTRKGDAIPFEQAFQEIEEATKFGCYSARDYQFRHADGIKETRCPAFQIHSRELKTKP